MSWTCRVCTKSNSDATQKCACCGRLSSYVPTEKALQPSFSKADIEGFRGGVGPAGLKPSILSLTFVAIAIAVAVFAVALGTGTFTTRDIRCGVSMVMKQLSDALCPEDCHEDTFTVYDE